MAHLAKGPGRGRLAEAGRTRSSGLGRYRVECRKAVRTGGGRGIPALRWVAPLGKPGRQWFEAEGLLRRLPGPCGGELVKVLA